MADLNINSMLDEEQKKQKQKILGDLKKIEQSFEMTVPKDKEEYKPVYTKIDLKNVDDAEIENKATQNLSYYKAKGEKDINDKFNESKSSLSEELNSISQSAKESTDKIKENAKSEKESTKNSLINKNLARSSIYNSLMTDIEKQELSDLESVKAESETKIGELNKKLESLDNEKQSALELFDIAYAVKLQEEIDGIKKELNDYNEKATKYNDDIAKKEKELEAKYEQQYQDYLYEVEEKNRKVLEFLQKYGYGTISNKLSSQKYEVVLNYLNTLTKESALAILTENDDFQNELGKNTYNKLLEVIKNRKE